MDVLRTNLYKIWNSEWNKYPHARQTKQFFPGIRTRISRDLLKLDRRSVGRFIHLITGHNNLNYHCSLRDPLGEHESMCRLCGEERETFYHFITTCPRLLSARAEIFCSWNGPRTEGCNWKVDDIIRFSMEPEVNEAFEFYGALGIAHYDSDSDRDL